MHDNSELLPLKVFCERFGVSRTLAYREISSGRLPALKVGRLTRIELRAARKWAAALPRIIPKAA